MISENFFTCLCFQESHSSLNHCPHAPGPRGRGLTTGSMILTIPTAQSSQNDHLRRKPGCVTPSGSDRRAEEDIQTPYPSPHAPPRAVPLSHVTGSHVSLHFSFAPGPHQAPRVVQLLPWPPHLRSAGILYALLCLNPRRALWTASQEQSSKHILFYFSTSSLPKADVFLLLICSPPTTPTAHILKSYRSVSNRSSVTVGTIYIVCRSLTGLLWRPTVVRFTACVELLG